MEDGWVLLREASLVSGLTTKTVHHRAKAYGLHLRKVRVDDPLNPYRIYLRRDDIPLLARKPRSAYKTPVLPPAPSGMVLLSHIAADHGVKARTLRSRIHLWKIPHSRIDHRFIVSREDVPLLFKRPLGAPMYRLHTPSLAIDGLPVSKDSDSVVRFVAAQFQITPERLYSRERMTHVIEAKYIAISVLRRLGMYPAQLARHFGRDHSTILHALHKVQEDPQSEALVQEIIEHLVADNPRKNLDTQLDHVLQDTRMSIIAAIRAYLRDTLLGWERHRAATATQGLAHLAADDSVRKAVVGVLKRLDLGQHVPRMNAHIAASGFRKVAS